MSLSHELWCKILDYKNDYVGHPFDLIIGINQWSKDGKLWSLQTLGGAKPSFDRVLPVLHPLDELYKEIEHKGEKFVPINKLKTYFGWSYLWDCYKKGETINVYAIPYACLSKLIEWHFNLMDEGEEFIDVNTLEVNPYK